MGAGRPWWKILKLDVEKELGTFTWGVARCSCLFLWTIYTLKSMTTLCAYDLRYTIMHYMLQFWQL